MLVVRRKAGETLVIGNHIRITVLETHAGGVKIGIEAPPEVSIHRAEVLETVGDANRQAAAGRPSPSLAARLRRPAGQNGKKPAPAEGE